MGGASTFATRFAGDRAGVSAILIGLCLSVMLSAAGLAVDVGLWYADRRAAQGAADAAAYSAAVDYMNSTSPSVSLGRATALAVAAQYGFVNGSGGVTVTVNSPPTSGSYTSASDNAFEVIISKTEPLFFASFDIAAAAIKARAVSVPGAAGKYCVELLNSTPGALNVNFTLSGAATVDLSSCGIADNGPGSCAISATGGVNIVAKYLSVVGNYCTSGGSTVTITGAKTVGAAAVANPYASLSVSTVEGSTNMTCPNATATTYASGGKTYTISPGVYCGGFTVANGVTVNMNPGIYYIVGGVFSLSGGTTTNANGVTIVLTGSLLNYATANIQPGANLNVTAPTSGATAGIAMWADANSPIIGAPLTSYVAGGGTMLVNGALYFPTQAVNFSNDAYNGSSCTQLVAYNVTFQGGARFTNTCASDGVRAIGSNANTSLVE
jgi:hypothetical protein